MNFQLKFQTETVEIKQVSIFIFDRKSQIMQMFIPKINITQYMLWGCNVVKFFATVSTDRKVIQKI